MAAKAPPGRPQRAACAVGAARRLPCGARSRGPPQNSLRSLRSLRSNRLRQVSLRSALRARSTSPVLLGAPDGRCGLPERAFAGTTCGAPTEQPLLSPQGRGWAGWRGQPASSAGRDSAFRRRVYPRASTTRPSNVFECRERSERSELFDATKGRGSGGQSVPRPTLAPAPASPASALPPLTLKTNGRRKYQYARYRLQRRRVAHLQHLQPLHPRRRHQRDLITFARLEQRARDG